MGRGAGKGGHEAWEAASTKAMDMTAFSVLSAMSTAQASGSGARLTTAARSILSSKPESPADRSLENSRRSIALARKLQLSAGAHPSSFGCSAACLLGPHACWDHTYGLDCNANHGATALAMPHLPAFLSRLIPLACSQRSAAHEPRHKPGCTAIWLHE